MCCITAQQPVEHCNLLTTKKAIQLRNEMETMGELIPFAREILSQRPNRKMVKIYVVGSVLAFFGVVIGLVETVCSPFAAASEQEEQPELPGKLPREPSREQKKLQEAKGQIARNGSYRKHAS